MSRPVTPYRSVTTLDSLIADSSSFSARCFSRVRSPGHVPAVAVCGRIIRNSGVATKQEVMAPRSKHAASHRSRILAACKPGIASVFVHLLRSEFLKFGCDHATGVA
jgi:hypothetical protein